MKSICRIIMGGEKFKFDVSVLLTNSSQTMPLRAKSNQTLKDKVVEEKDVRMIIPGA